MCFFFQRMFSSSLLKDSIPNLDFVPKSGYHIFLNIIENLQQFHLQKSLLPPFFG